MDWTIGAIKCEDVLEFLCEKKKVSVRLAYHLRILRDAIIAVAVVGLILIVREGKEDAYLFIGKRYIQLVNFVTKLVPQKNNKKK